MVARRWMVGVAGAAPKLMETLRVAVGSDVDLIDAGRPTRAPRAMDLVLIGAGRGWQVTDHFVAAGYRVALCADIRDEREEYAAIEHGAAGYLVLSATPEVLQRTISAAAAGEPVFRRAVLGRWLRSQSRQTRGGTPGYMHLTARQQQVLALIAEGATNKEIAAALRIKTSTVDKHITNLLTRMGAPNRAAAVGLMHGLRPRSDQRLGAA